jgi:light-regulated signal transduction histidine kinase (bacteriophytochrome)
VVAAIAEAHHGSVRVNSKLGRGATFELLLPAAAEAADGAQSPAVRSGKSSLRVDRY